MGGTPSKQKGRTSSKQSQLETADRPTPPGKPQLVPGTPRSEPDVVTISWEPSQYDGGSKITGYLVEHRRTGSPHWVRASPVLGRQPQLTLSGLEPGWRYQFRVSAKNAVGYSEPGELSELLTVTLQRSAASAPHFLKELEDTVALENEKAELSVQVKGTPPPTIAWYKDGLEIYSSRRQKILTENDTTTLLIYQAVLSDEGEIKCTATNRVGHAVTRARIRLEAPPGIRLPRQYEEGLIFEKDEVIRLRVAVVGRPTPDVTWLHNGEVLPHGGRFEVGHSERYASLRVGEARRTDRGEYQVRAVNKLGEDVASFLVTVTDRPIPPGKARVAMTLGRSVTLSWTTPDDDGGCKIGNYIVEYYRIGWNMWLKAATCRQLTTTLGDLIEGSEYKFRVKAENPYGVSDPSEESDVVFIPDPKRGLLEPPERSLLSLDSDHAIEKWLDERKRHLETASSPVRDDQYSVKKKKKKRNMVSLSADEDIKKSSLVQINTKNPVKQNFKSIHSEDSMSPTVTPEPQTTRSLGNEHPVVPKRKTKGDKKEKEVQIVPERKKKISSKISADENVGGIASGKNQWEDEDEKPRDEEDILHDSTEMMLVLLPNSRATTEEREYMRKNDFLTSLEDSEAVAPPMSLSAPELGSEEPLEFPPMRPAVSSSELLHERTMYRFYQDMAKEELNSSLKRRTSLERRRSFERRSSKGKDIMLPILKVRSTEEITKVFNDSENKELIMPKMQDTSNQESHKGYDSINEISSPLFARLSTSKESMDSIQEYSKNTSKLIPQSSEEDEEYEDESLDEEEEEIEEEGELEAEEILDEELKEEEDEENLENEYDDDEYENDFDNYNMSESEEDFRQSDFFQEDTYHPRSMIPKGSTIQDTRNLTNKSQTSKTEEITKLNKNENEPLSISTNKSSVMNKKETLSKKTTLSKIHFSNYHETQKKEIDLENEQYFKIDRNRLSGKPDLHISIPQPSLSPDLRHTPSTSPIIPKPILKMRDHSQERSLESLSKRNKYQAPIAAVEPELNIISKAASDNILNTNSDYLGTGVKLRKKIVRIKEPVQKMTESFKNVENEIGISAAEVARNRRRRSGSLGEDSDPSKIVISHYSDIVAEFGKTKRIPVPKYLNYEELHAAAQKEESPIERQNQKEEITVHVEEKQTLSNTETTGNGAKLNTLQTMVLSEQIDHFSTRESPVTPVVTVRHYTGTERKMHTFFDFILDLALFLVACWLYAFKDERLAIPIILLMIYRQTFEAVRKRLPSRWKRKEKE